MKKKIILVGGGYVGIELARGLDNVAEVTLVEPKSAFVHSVAAIRAVVKPELLDRLIVPYDRLMKSGTIVKAKVVEIGDRYVVLDDGRTLEADYIVSATGSTYARPFKPHTTSISEFRTQTLAAHDAVEAAKYIAIVGAGPVGVEMAAEIAVSYADKRISLIAASPDVVPGISKKLSAALRPQLDQIGIDVRLGTMVDGLTYTDRPFQGQLQVAGQEIPADLIIPALGARPIATPMSDGTLAPSGRLAVDPWMRPIGREHVFSIGDAAETGEPMTIVAVRRQARWLVQTLRSLLAGKPLDSLAPYAPASKPLLLVPIGPEHGTSILPLGPTGRLFGSWITRTIKGRGLFLPRTRKELGYT